MADDAPEWSPPKLDEKTGVALHGDYPVNSRLRAEALASDGKAEDPDGLVSRELIEDAGKRLAADREAEAEARRISPRMTVADLEAIAAAEGADLSDASNNEERVAAIQANRDEQEA